MTTVLTEEVEPVYEIKITKKILTQLTGKGYYRIKYPDDTVSNETQYIDHPAGVYNSTEKEVMKLNVTNLNLNSLLIHLTQNGEVK